jgi:CTP:molybdopterin cytidylyltransferase MocA
VRRLAGILLAAGASRRMGTPKAALVLEGETLVARGLRGLHAASCDPLVVVTGVHHDAVLAALPSDPPAGVVRNPDPTRGQLSSLKTALLELRSSPPEVVGALVALVDHPTVRTDTYRTLAQAGLGAATSIVLPVCDGRRGHPVVFLRVLWEELLAAPDNEGARVVVRRDPVRVTELPVADPGILLDIDTPEAFARLPGTG